MNPAIANDRRRAHPAAAPPEDEAARVRLGAQSTTPDVVLIGLACDPSVTVRAAVAMNAAAGVDVDAILARDADERVRALLARKLANLVPAISAAAQDAMEKRVYNILASLVMDEAVRVRAAIAEVVREMPNAPKDLILRLARDVAVPVSDPVIRLSPLLTAADLLALLADPPSPATSVSIARRPGLNVEVSDAIAQGANSAAIAALLANSSAAIREATLDTLIARAADHVEWHEPLVNRPVLPARAARALSEIVAAHLLQSLSRRNDLEPTVLREIGTRLSRSLSGAPASPLPATDMTDEQAMDAASAMAAQGRLTEEALLGAVQRGEARLTTALLAHAAAVPISVVDRAARLRSVKGLVALTWRAGFGMSVGVPLQSLLARLPPAAILHAGPGGSYPLAIEEMRWQVDFLTRMDR